MDTDGMPAEDRKREQRGISILQALADRGYEAYFVGGCVRDRLAGRPVKDYDIATSALPEAVMRVFAHTVPTGLKHGTVTVLLDGEPFEVTTFRKESAYERHRRPEQVEFISDLHEDLRRRDFTINAMALRQDGALVDPFGGADDLAAGLLRCVGDPEERFREDALRMLRCLRFACEYALQIDPPTWRALLRLRPLLRHIAMERVRVELEKMLEGRFPARAVHLLAETGVLGFLKTDLGLPELGKGPAALKHADSLALTEEGALRWAAFWLIWPAESDKARLAMERLTFPRKKEDRIRRIMAFGEWLEHRSGETAESAERARELFVEAALSLGRQAADDWRRLPVRTTAHRLAGRADDWLAQLPVESVRELAIGGKELAALTGRPGGPWLGQVLDKLLRDVAIGGLSNEREALLRRASRYAAARTGGTDGSEQR